MSLEWSLSLKTPRSSSKRLDFSEVKTQIPLQIQKRGFSSPETQKAREYLDALILAEEMLNTSCVSR